MNEAIIVATFVRLQTMADGSPRLVLDVDGDLGSLSGFNLKPGTTFALARIDDQAVQDHAVQETLKGGALSIEAAGMCKSDRFQKFSVEQSGLEPSEENAKNYIYGYCGIESRALLDHDFAAEQKFYDLKLEFMRWDK